MGRHQLEVRQPTVSYWVMLLDSAGDPVRVPRHWDGGTYILGGNDLAELNVTGNYGGWISSVIEGGIKWLDGRRAGDCVDVLRTAVGMLGTQRSEDYWAATAGNAGYALSILLAWAIQHPDAVFLVS